MRWMKEVRFDEKIQCSQINQNGIEYRVKKIISKKSKNQSVLNKCACI